jgi:hypothetical protein
VARGGKSGVLAMARARARGPGHERHRVGQRQPEDDGTGSCTGEAGEEREGRERGGGGWLVGQLTEWASSREKRRAKSLRVDRPGGEGPAGKEREGEGAAAMRGPWGLNYKMNFDINFKSVPTWFESKPVFPTQKIKIKYGCEGFEERNNFLHSNFFRFEMDFELKFREFSMS